MDNETLINELVRINYEIRDMQTTGEIKEYIRNRIESHKQFAQVSSQKKNLTQ